ncbi:MAG: phosphoribosylglycinamide formyltransferase [Christensenellales bacterium]|jgi:phosphoribosylglycinamide formyltransferase-1|nr:phosphoribosylglycinamide formyltransferase [Clostridiales bacterium]
MEKTRIAILVSGGGTNLQALIDAQHQGVIKHGAIDLVISDREGAYAITRAEQAGITALSLPKKGKDARDWETDLLRVLAEHRIGLVVLAGFLTILSPRFIKAYENRIVNVHPSLLPAFGGKGFYGLKVHEAALARGVKLTGATVHLVNKEADGGPILLQKAVKVKKSDTPQTLQQRVMEKAEWILLPKAVELLCKRKGNK